MSERMEAKVYRCAVTTTTTVWVENADKLTVRQIREAAKQKALERLSKNHMLADAIDGAFIDIKEA